MPSRKPRRLDTARLSDRPVSQTLVVTGENEDFAMDPPELFEDEEILVAWRREPADTKPVAVLE